MYEQIMVIFLIMALFFELQQHSVPQKIIFFMSSYYYENEIIIKSGKLEKVNFTVA